jgi:predicted O-methyltransferase YrrM
MLNELRNKCKQRNIPIISVATEDFLMKILKKYRPKVCLEIGGAVGYSGIFMAEIIKQR